MPDFETGRMTDANGDLVIARAYPSLEEGRIVIDAPAEFPFRLSTGAQHEEFARLVRDAYAAIGVDLAELLDRAAMPGQPATEGGAPTPGPFSRCTFWSDPSDDFYGRCIKNVVHSREGASERERAHENAKGIQWHGQRWEPATEAPLADEAAAAAGAADAARDAREAWNDPHAT